MKPGIVKAVEAVGQDEMGNVTRVYAFAVESGQGSGVGDVRDAEGFLHVRDYGVEPNRSEHRRQG